MIMRAIPPFFLLAGAFIALPVISIKMFLFVVFEKLAVENLIGKRGGL